MKYRSVLLPHLSWVVHNGSKAIFWDNAWNGYYPLDFIRDWTPLKSILLDRWGIFLSNYFDVVRNGQVKMAKWKSIDCLNVNPNLKVEFCTLLKERVIILFEREDELIWTKSASGNYTVKDGYNSLMPAKDFSPWPFKLFWHSTCLPKAGTFSWLAIQDKVLTGMRLDRMGLSAIFPCVLCNKNLESSSHLFLHWDFAFGCWQWLFEKLGLSFVIGNDLLSHFRAWPILFSSSFYACLWLISPLIIIWDIWFERNNGIFRKLSALLSDILVKIEDSILEVALSYIHKNLENLTSFSHWDGRITRTWKSLSTIPSHGSIAKGLVISNKRLAARWDPPPLGHFKIHFDGASRGNPGLAGVGMAIFDHNVVLIAAQCHTLGS